MSNSLACRLEASATHNVISDIVIFVDRDLGVIMISHSGGEFPSGLQKMGDEGGIAGINFQRVMVSWH